MAYCVQCGNQVRPTDRFCAKCGSPQAFATSGATSGSADAASSSASAGANAGAATGTGANAGSASGAGPASGFTGGPGAGTGFGGDFLAGLSSRNASLLCYIPMLGWIAAIIVLASERFRHDIEVRFHAFQGLYLFVAWLIVEWVVEPARAIFVFWPMHTSMSLFSHLLELAIIFAWIFMLIRVSQGQSYKLPIVGELAERSVSEQRA